MKFSKIILSIAFVTFTSAYSIKQCTSSTDFNATIRGTQKVIVDFYADWCNPCRTISSRLENIAKKHPEITVIKINIENNPELATQYNVKSIPTILFFNNGALKKTVVGLQKESELEQAIAATYR